MTGLWGLLEKDVIGYKVKRWNDIGVVLSSRRYGDAKAIVDVITQEHGIVNGLHDINRKSIHVMQSGNIVEVDWNCRKEGSFGYMKCHLVKSPLDYPCYEQDKLLAVLSLATLSGNLVPCSLPDNCLFMKIYDFMNKIDSLTQNDWMWKYVDNELALLKYAGFALDLSKCTVSGAVAGLRYISPKTGKAVTALVGESYAGKLFNMPQCLYNVFNGITNEVIDCIDFINSLKILGYFLQRNALSELGKKEPDYRVMMYENMMQKVNSKS